ncbi:hypothetical protein ColTof4_03010 [Colletotrichum tofieldiae]|nr:hypothetical protein ColTof3_13583 [Colletotrichum tofieldiae]GKT70587.1 hypothetical protein ColTof4_03010 [Colletotrichum tofieldiae]GKT94544.1 hypothetical protein Ct61P_12394 [Colletotrichum tofieldiae]
MPAKQPSDAPLEPMFKTMVFRVLSAAALLFYVAIYLPVSLLILRRRRRPNCAPCALLCFVIVVRGYSVSLRFPPQWLSLVRVMSLLSSQTRETESPARRQQRALLRPLFLFLLSPLPIHPDAR